MLPLRDVHAGNGRRTDPPIVTVALIVLNALFLQVLPGLSTLGATDAEQAGGVAWFAHIGGFAAGPILLLLLGGRRQARGGARAA